MREIKFRAWDKEREEMLPVTNMNWNEWWVSCEPILDEVTHPLDYGEMNSFKNEETDRQILMQYTGLKDKNGQEIYEGDILRITCNFELRKGVVNQSVDYWNGSFSTNEWLFHELIDNVAKGKQEFEVIGNIYDNPKLLEGR